METDLLLIKKENPQPELWSAKSLPLVRKYLADLKSHLHDHPFRRRSEEIQFFKEMKPRILARLLFFGEVFNFTSDCPSIKKYAETKAYWIAKRRRIDGLLEDQKDFYEYLRAGHDYMDRQIFIRYPKNPLNFHGLPVDLDPAAFYGDPEFSTSHDYRTAQFFAMEELQAFIYERFVELEASVFLPRKKIRFTGSPDDFVEFVRLMHAIGKPVDAVNNEEVSRPELAKRLMEDIHVDLGAYPDYATLEACSKGSDFVERLDKCLENYYARWDQEEKDVEYNADGKAPE